VSAVNLSQSAMSKRFSDYTTSISTVWIVHYFCDSTQCNEWFNKRDLQISNKYLSSTRIRSFYTLFPQNPLINILIKVLISRKKYHHFLLIVIICLAVVLFAASCISPLVEVEEKKIMRATISNGLCVNALQRRITLINLCINRPLRYVHIRDKKRKNHLSSSLGALPCWCRVF